MSELKVSSVRVFVTVVIVAAAIQAQAVEETSGFDSITQGSVSVGAESIAYQAVAGVVTVGAKDAQDANLDLEGKPLESAGAKPAEEPAAHMSYVAYFRRNSKPNRPISFIFNGGPGVSSSLLHLGAFGPRRVVAPDAQPDTGAPYRIVNNNYSLLDASDLVFIDAPGTGFGKITGPDKERAFWGDEQDTHAFDRFIRRFLTKYARWNSPKFLIGESYGTLRNAELAATLENVNLSGIVMLSQVLNLTDFPDETLRMTPGSDQGYALALPSYAAIAFHYRKLPSQPPSFDAFLAEVEQFALGEYMSALLQGSELPAARRQAIAEKLHAYTGLPLALLLQADLRIRSGVFQKNLLLDQGVTIGSPDARYQGPDLDPLSYNADSYDPASAAFLPAFVVTANDYLRNQLGVGRDLTYKFHVGSDEHFDWIWHHGTPEQAAEDIGLAAAINVLPHLAYAMKLNPRLKVLVTGGYFDLSTPFFAGIYEMHHLQIPPNLQANVSYHYYPSGHVVYLSEESLRLFHSDVAEFIRDATGGR